MSEETDTVAEPHEQQEQQEHHPKKQSSGGSGAFMAILLAIGALGASYYLWQQQQVTNANTKALQGQINKLLGVIEQRQQELLQRMQTVPAHQHPEINQRLDKMQASLFELQSHLGQERRGWQIAEVEYLLRIAEHRLNLEHDLPTAIAALQTASQKLQSLRSPAFTPVIALIGEDINRLSAVNLPDRDKLAEQIAAINSSVDNMPLAAGTVQSSKSTTANNAPVDDEKRSFWQKMWHDLLGLVTIRRDGEAERPMLVPEQRYFLKQNLHLKLESARLALLAGNAATWRDSLGEASSWLSTYFDKSASSVQGAMDTLTQLGAADLNPVLPELSDTRRLLQQAAMKLPAAPVKTPSAVPVEPAPEAEAPVQEPASEAPAADAAKPAPAESSGDAPAEPDTAATTADTPPKQAPAGPDVTAPATEDVPALPQGEGQ